MGSVAQDYGLTLRPWPDIPLGIVAGVASQYLLVPVVEAPLLPFVHHLYSRLGHPAQSLTGDTFGTGLVVLAVLVCVGSPVVEELFFAACSCARSWAASTRAGHASGLPSRS